MEYMNVTVLLKFLFCFHLISFHNVAGFLGEMCKIDVYDVHFFGKSKRAEYCDHGCCQFGGKTSCCTSANIGLISGLAVSGIALMSIAILYLYCCYWKKQQRKYPAVIQLPTNFINIQEDAKVHVVNPPEYTPEDCPPSYEEVIRGDNHNTRVQVTIRQ
ncbi:hypothetical protein LOTGIDRAFT_236517 [Lottia gigantea]|uniref:Vesicular, overexpressed in cancer, prosurvival protein 1 n=1 Tax=Lottia gigantea TaxID=225164 RepID=V3ZMK9_LOTGI|nr:hypothetical protein LOTGIDRAFT_236517 [Lottia gigantea]ESO83685.1 hypothetical protein LOTGIDRAFT_236517 [Lottia gigantea]